MYKEIFHVCWRYIDQFLGLMDALTQYQYRINNVKLSIIFLSKLRVEEFRSNLLEKWKNEVSFSKNIIIIRSKYTCTIFHKTPGKYHVNLTKVPSLDEIGGSLDYVITKYFSPLKFHLIKYKIDNISASLSLNRFISLHYLAVHSKISVLIRNDFQEVYLSFKITEVRWLFLLQAVLIFLVA